MCAAPIILAVIVLIVIEYQRYALEKTRQQRARAKLESDKSANSSAGSPTHESDVASTRGWAPSVHDDLVFPPEAVLAGVLFNRRRFFFGRSLDSHQGPCVVAAPQRRCLMVWQGMPPRFEDDFEYLAHSEGVTFSWTAWQPGHPWPSNVVRLTATSSGPGRKPQSEEFYYGRSPGFGRSSLLAGVVRLSESSKLIVIDNQRVRLFPQYELLVRNTPGYPVERWHQCQDRCSSTEGAVFGGLEGGSPTLVGRAFFDGRLSPCKVVAVGCVLPGGQNLRDLWLNADIVEGPGGRPDVDAQHFLQLCTSRFPQATLSLGWTTRPMSSYSWAHVEAMARLLVCGPYRVPRVTFPVRASMLAASTPQLLWLLDLIPGSTLTVWSSPRDPWSTKALMKLRALLPLTAVYYDLPSDQKEDFDRAKALVSSPTPHNHHVDDGPLPEWSLGIGYSCQNRALAGKRAVVLAGPGARLLMPDKWDLVEAKVDLSRVGSLALGWGQDTDKVQINGGCFYIALTNGANVTAQVWASSCLPTSSSFDEEDHDKKGYTLRSEKPLVTRQWPSSPSPPTQTSTPTPMVSAPSNSLLFESPGAAVVYDVRISFSSAVSRATPLTALLLLCVATALAALLLC
ncbi:uncharacterized protein LOC119174193 isoform X1 [Rhipicephalus microplus]|uniref:uncharacterized protein LOC119174193 isoform X1 n=1 Tax=Rhipicephalus microplus TaxID=6941 RepID=UPI003F6D1B56